MIVCVCKRVSDRHIRAEVDAGAESLRDVSRRLGVGTQCGKCVGSARAIIAETCELRRQTVLVPPPVCPDAAQLA